MNYRTLGRTGLQVSRVSLGTEYLIGAPHERIVSVIREALAQDINYFDLFCAQPEFRDAMGKAFAGQRDKAILAAHLGAATKDGQYQKTRSLKKSRLFFEDFLTRYNTDYVDVLFLHNCDSEKDLAKVMNPDGFLGLALELKKAGKARFLGFSGHTAATAQHVVESGHIDVLMYPVGIMGHAGPGKNALLRACVEHDVGMVAMKPYGGGKLLQDKKSFNVPKYASGGASYTAKKRVSITPVQCLSYSLSQVGVSTVVPGCSNLEHLSDALAYETASQEERDYAEIVVDFEQYSKGDCVYCNHCLPCPAHIDIGQTMRLLDLKEQGVDRQEAYAAMTADASDCTRCGACEARCPFGVAVMERMRQAVPIFG